MKGRGGGCLIPTLLSLENAHVEYLLNKKKGSQLILDLVMIGLITATSSDDFPEFREVEDAFSVGQTELPM